MNYLKKFEIIILNCNIIIRTFQFENLLLSRKRKQILSLNCFNFVNFTHKILFSLAPAAIYEILGRKARASDWTCLIFY